MRNGIPDFRPSSKHEEPRGDIEIWSETLWAKVPKLVRDDVEAYLREKILEHAPQVLEKWKGQHSRGIRVGSDDPMFHLGVGMHVRNTCRDQLTDGELPVVTVDHEGKPYGPSQNWDDYYFGVLAAIAA
jgi:hypothetical protein